MINNEIALRNTYDMLALLNSGGCMSWVQDGTLLGLVRDGHVMRWDHDTDIGLWTPTWKPACWNWLENAGFTSHSVLGTQQSGWQQRWTRNGVKTDIFFYYTDDAGNYWHSAYLRNTVEYRFTYAPFKLTTIDTTTGSMPAPDPPEHFLETKYGPDWRTPKRRWHFATSPLNSTKVQ